MKILTMINKVFFVRIDHKEEICENTHDKESRTSCLQMSTVIWMDLTHSYGNKSIWSNRFYNMKHEYLLKSNHSALDPSLPCCLSIRGCCLNQKKGESNKKSR